MTHLLPPSQASGPAGSLRRDRPIVVLTGAGVSAESGLPTFRGMDGLWEGRSVLEVATPEGFQADPEASHRFYNQRRAKLLTVQPNPAHQSLARLEAHWPGGVVLVTQNVDDLHERGGSKQVLHLHGELRKVQCWSCPAVSSWEGDLGVHDACPGCGQRTLRPHIVWFGESVLAYPEAEEAVSDCAAFIAIGTSGVVFPAASLVIAAPEEAWTVEVNLELTNLSDCYTETRLGAASEVVPALVEELLAGLA